METVTRARSVPQRTALLLWLGLSVYIVYGSTIPFRFTADTAFASNKLARVPLAPWISPETGRRVSIPDVFQNLILFVPFGGLGMLSAQAPTLRRVIWITLLAAALSMTIETLQFFTRDRIASVSDIVANTTGALIGAFLARRFAEVWSSAVTHAANSELVRRETFYPATIAALGVCMAAWQPFDASIDVSSWVGKLRTLRHDVWQIGPVRDEGVAIIRYALFAFAACAWTRRPFWSALAGAAAAFALEASQIAITSRMPGLEDAVVGTAGAIVGTLIWMSWRSVSDRGWRARFMLALLIVATIAGQILAWSTTPSAAALSAEPNDDATLTAIATTVDLFLVYFPIGFCASRIGLSWASVTARVLALTAVTLLAAGMSIGIGGSPSACAAVAGIGSLLGAWAGRR
jgi:glycopeptide antibiotics resistance protein